jgi:hypothetical protein
MKAYCEGAGEEAKGDLRDEEPQGCDRLPPQSLDDPGWLHSKSSQVQFVGTVPRDFRLQVFFHELVSPKPLSPPLGPFQIFPKIGGDIHSTWCTTGVTDTVANGKNLQEENF